MSSRRKASTSTTAEYVDAYDNTKGMMIKMKTYSSKLSSTSKDIRSEQQAEAAQDDIVEEVRDNTAGGHPIPGAEDDDPSHWTWAFDDSSQSYYYINVITQTTQWERPTCLDDDQGQEKDQVGETNASEEYYDYTDVYGKEDKQSTFEAVNFVGSKRNSVADNSATVKSNTDHPADEINNWSWALDEASGQYYYINLIDNTTQWERPSCFDYYDDNNNEDENDDGDNDDDDEESGRQDADAGGADGDGGGRETGGAARRRRSSSKSRRASADYDESSVERNEAAAAGEREKQLQAMCELLPFSKATIEKLHGLSILAKQTAREGGGYEESSQPRKNSMSKLQSPLKKELMKTLEMSKLLPLLSSSEEVKEEGHDDADSSSGTLDSSTDAADESSLLASILDKHTEKDTERIPADIDVSRLLTDDKVSITDIQSTLNDVTFNQFAMTYFESIVRNTILRAQKVLAKTIMWSPNAIGRPLLSFETYHSSDDADSTSALSAVQFSTKAVKVFEHVLAFMGDRRSKKNSLSHASAIVKSVLESRDDILIDETFCQICKQIERNPSTKSILSAWRLMLICLTSFPPSKRLFPHLLAFICDNHSKCKSSPPYLDESAELIVESISQSIEYTVLSMKSPRRREEPSRAELDAMTSNIFTTVKVYLLNNTEIELKATSWTTVREFSAQLARYLGIAAENEAAFALYECSHLNISSQKDGHFLLLRGQERLMDMVNSMNKKIIAGYKRYTQHPLQASAISTYKLVYKVRYFLDHDSQAYSDPETFNMYYIQGVYDVSSERYHCSRYDYYTLASIHAQHVIASGRLRIERSGGAAGVNGSPSSSSTAGVDIVPLLNQILPTVLPTSITPVNFAALTELSKQIQRLVSCIKHYSSYDAQMAYLDYMKSFKLYGSVIFKVETRLSSSTVDHLPEACTLAITPTSLYILEQGLLAITLEYALKSVITWGHSHNSFMITTFSPEQVKLKVYFKTERGEEIADVMNVQMQKYR